MKYSSDSANILYVICLPFMGKVIEWQWLYHINKVFSYLDWVTWALLIHYCVDTSFSVWYQLYRYRCFMVATLLRFMTKNTRIKLVHIIIVTVGPLRKYIPHKYTLKDNAETPSQLNSDVMEYLLSFRV